MIIIFIIAFLATFLLNFAVIVLGKDTMAQLRTDHSLKHYLSEANALLTDSLGDQGATVVKLSLVVIAGLFLIFNLIPTLVCLLAVVVAVIAAKAVLRIRAVSEMLNRLATYINRLR
jgi:hypothetical protein